MIRRIVGQLCLLLLSTAATADKGDLIVRGSVTTTMTQFPDTPGFAAQRQGAYAGFITGNFWADYRDSGDRDQFRLDVSERASLDGDGRAPILHELRYRHMGDQVSFLVGYSTVFWGVIESRHLVDIVNQQESIIDPINPQKLGQLMVNVESRSDYGLFNFYLLPNFVERRFPTEQQRFSGGASVGPAVFNDNRSRPAFALRYSNWFGKADFGISYFSGLGREPRLVATDNDNGNSQTSLTPYYDRIHQLGIDAQATVGQTLWKLEYIARRGFQQNFQAASVGLEHTWAGIYQRADLGFLTEFHYDGRSDEAPGTLYRRAVFIGLRLALNDQLHNSSLLAGVTRNSETGSYFANVQAETNVGKDWKVRAYYRRFAHVSPTETLYAFARDGHFQLQITKYF